MLKELLLLDETKWFQEKDTDKRTESKMQNNNLNSKTAAVVPLLDTTVLGKDIYHKRRINLKKITKTHNLGAKQ